MNIINLCVQYQRLNKNNDMSEREYVAHSLKLRARGEIRNGPGTVRIPEGSPER